MREVNLTEHSVCDAGKKNMEMSQVVARAAEQRAMVSEKNKVSRDMGTQYTDALVIRGYFSGVSGFVATYFRL